jgi:hypothetical protein
MMRISMSLWQLWCHHPQLGINPRKSPVTVKEVVLRFGRYSGSNNSSDGRVLLLYLMCANLTCIANIPLTSPFADDYLAIAKKSEEHFNGRISTIISIIIVEHSRFCSQPS